MTPNLLKPSTLTAFGALIASLAALTLTACDPHDSALTPLVAKAALQAPADPAPPARQGTPVPAPNGTPTVTSVAAAPPYPAQPPVPAPLPSAAQSGRTTATQPTGYAVPPTPSNQARVREARAIDRSRVGSVARIEPIHQRPQGTGAGAVIGGVLGAVVGNQFGHGAGRAAMTGVGAVGGAVAGNNLERNHRETITGYRVSVRLDNGSTRTFERSHLDGLHVGDRVRLDGGSLHRV